MFENIAKFFKKLVKSESKDTPSKDTAKERLHLVLMQDRANVSADFLELMKQEIIEVIKKYIEVEESAIDVRLTNEIGEDGTKGAPSLYANIPILNIKNNIKKENTDNKQEEKNEENKEEKKEPIEEIKEEKSEDNQEDKKEEIEKVENKDIEETEENKEIKEEAKKDNKQEVESDTHSDPQHEPEKKENKNVVNKKTTNSKNSKKNK